MAKPTILYVDDERQNLKSFHASFRRYYTIHLAQSGAEAIAHLHQHSIEVILSDQRMPQMTGVQLFEHILTDFPAPIRMVVTGYSDMEAIIQAVNKGQIYYYIAKPWDHDELRVVIDKGVEAYRLKSENKALHHENQLLELRTEQQARQQLLSRFETLKNQVNPHFLFNSLNVLSSLVHEDPDLAEDFIAKLTRVYRYVLDLKEQVLLPLEAELAFIKSYFFLHQIRFGNKLRLYVQVPPEDQQCLLPPFTLQLLVENAIKHNVITHQQPLTIELFTEGREYFVVRNNFQARTEKIDSTGIGLQNLRGRYALLGDQEPEFGQIGAHYVARVPLLTERPPDLR